MRYFIGAKGTDPRWCYRWVEVLVRGRGPGPRNACVRFDTGETVVVPTFSGGRGATLRLHELRGLVGQLGIELAGDVVGPHAQIQLHPEIRLL